MFIYLFSSVIFFFNATATTEIYTLSLHDALPISSGLRSSRSSSRSSSAGRKGGRPPSSSSSVSSEIEMPAAFRSEEHTSELQSLRHLVCRLLLEKKKDKNMFNRHKIRLAQIEMRS